MHRQATAKIQRDSLGCRYYLDEKSSDAKPAAAVQPVKKTLNADELLKQAEEEAGDDAVHARPLPFYRNSSNDASGDPAS